MTPIYLDHAASTRVSDDVLALIAEVARTAWGNPSSAHPQGAAARGHIATARGRLLAALGGAATGDVVWTSGCTEADALALLGVVRRRPGPVVVSTVEHAAVAAIAGELAAAGGEVRRVAPGRDGTLDPDAFAEAADGATLAALVMVQNDLGVVQPVAAIAAAIRARNPACHIHVDAAQALGKVALDAGALGVDSIALAAHKLHGPKGCGALWLRGGVELAPLWVGGGQQGGRRGGTLDAPGIAGFGLAAERAIAALPQQRLAWLELAGALLAALDARGADIRPLIPDHRRAPHILALGVPGVPASALRSVLASRGVYVATGSACSEGDAKPAPALEAIGLPADTGMVRLSFGHDTTAAEVAAAADTLADVVRDLRARG